jgi:hypothetical protein
MLPRKEIAEQKLMQLKEKVDQAKKQVKQALKAVKKSKNHVTFNVLENACIECEKAAYEQYNAAVELIQSVPFDLMKDTEIEVLIASRLTHATSNAVHAARRAMKAYYNAL